MPREGHLDCVKFLLQQGADIHDRNEALWAKHRALLYLVPLQKKNSLGCVKFLIQQGADINDQNEYGDTALLMSAYRKDI